MTERQRNTAVGVFVIIGFVLLGVLILEFSDIVTVAKRGYLVTVTMENSRGAMPGKVVHFRGVGIGNVSEVRLDPKGFGVVMILRIESDVDIPANAELRASPSGFGDVYLDITLPSMGGKPVEPSAVMLPKDGSARLPGIAGSMQLIPESIVSSAEQLIGRLDESFGKLDKRTEHLETALKNVAALTEERSLEAVAAGQAKPNLYTAVAQLNRTMATLNDDSNPDNLKVIMARLRGDLDALHDTLGQAKGTLQTAQKTLGTADEKMTAVADDVREVKGKSLQVLDELRADALKLSNLLSTMNSLAKDAQEGKGTVGKLLTDDTLYRELVLLALQMKQTSQDISRLVVKLEEEGFLRRGDKK